MTALFPNYYAYRAAAERYALGRPYLHPAIVDRISPAVGIESFALVLDVACGTGQSTRAIAALAERVVALDSSREMLAQASRSPGVQFVVGKAEELPFPADLFDLLTVALGFHWFDQPRFLREARRVLKAGAWLVIYSYGFLGEMPGCAEFQVWFRQEYLGRFPNPPRAARAVTDEMLKPFAFSLRARETFSLSVEWTQVELVDFLLTQSNVIAAVERGSLSLPDAAGWIARGAAPYFVPEPRSLPFQVDMHFIQAGA